MADASLGSEVRSGEVRTDAAIESHLGRTLALFGRERVTGVLVLEGGALRASLYVHQGVVVFAEAGGAGEMLGRSLVRQGTLDEAECSVVLSRMAETPVVDEVMRFGEVAIELGLVSASDLSTALGRAVHEVVVRCLSLGAARWVFRADSEATTSVAHYPVELTAAVWEAVLAPEASMTWALRLLPSGDRAPVLRIDAGGLALPPDVLRIARQLDGTRSLADLLAPDEPSHPRRVGVVAALLVLDLVEMRAAPAPHVGASLRPGRASRRPKPASSAPSRPSNAPATASARSKRSQLAAAAGAPWAPATPAPTSPRASSPTARPAATSALPRRGAAAPSAHERAALFRMELERMPASAGRPGVPPERAREREVRVAPVSPREAYEHGRRALAEGNLVFARRQLEAASAARPDVTEYRLAAAFACWLATDDPTQRAADTEIVKALVTETLKADRRSALAHYVHGRVSLADDDTAAAALAFANACRLDPDDREMARWARHLGPPKKSRPKP